MNSTGKTCVLLFVCIYAVAFATAVFFYQLPFAGLITTVLFVGLGFSLIAWLLTKRMQLISPGKPAFKKEWMVLLSIIGWVVLYITFGGNLINNLLPANIQQNEQWQFFIVIARKLIVFVIVPYLVYRVMGFSIEASGLKIQLRKVFAKRNMFLFIVMPAGIMLFEYFFSNGARPLRDGQFNLPQLLIAIPLTFLWMFIEAGLVEEFFFRAILQSRIAVLIKSQWGAIVISGLIFGLAHVPGLYLRGAESEGITEQLPLGFWLCYCIVNMSIAGIFLGIIQSRTRNLYLVMALHAMVDLLPNLGQFIHTWQF